jgi:hypothetical protein
MEKKIYRKVKLGKAKDYRRDAKLYTYAHIVYKNTDILLNLYGWDNGNPVGSIDGEQFVEIDGKRIFLQWD